MPYNRVKELRVKHHITSTTLAKTVGVDHKTIRSYEEGITDTKTDILKRIAQYFHVSTDYILGLSELERPDDINLAELQIINNLPDILYYGTTRRFLETIKLEGLIPINCLYVYLSNDYETALNIALYYGDPIVFEVDAERMSKDGKSFYLSEKEVWLTEYVNPEYLAIRK